MHIYISSFSFQHAEFSGSMSLGPVAGNICFLVPNGPLAFDNTFGFTLHSLAVTNRITFVRNPELNLYLLLLLGGGVWIQTISL